MSSKKVVSLDEARKERELDKKEERVENMAQRFETALPTKATPVKDFLKKKRKKKKPQ